MNMEKLLNPDIKIEQLIEFKDFTFEFTDNLKFQVMNHIRMNLELMERIKEECMYEPLDIEACIDAKATEFVEKIKMYVTFEGEIK